MRLPSTCASYNARFMPKNDHIEIVAIFKREHLEWENSADFLALVGQSLQS